MAAHERKDPGGIPGIKFSLGLILGRSKSPPLIVRKFSETWDIPSQKPVLSVFRALCTPGMSTSSNLPSCSTN